MSTQTKGVAAYLFITFGVAWGLWAIPLSAGLSAQNPLFQLAILPGAFAPAVAAIIVRRYVTKEGFADAGLGLHLARWRYYVFALVLPVVVTLAIVAMALAFGVSHPDFSLRRSLQVLFAALGRPTSPSLPPAMLAVVPVQALIGAVIATPLLWGEEFGWRGYLQFRLFDRQPVRAGVVTGLVWGVWHYPLVLAGYQYPDNRWLGLLVLPVSTVLLSIVFGWLKSRTGSIWPACLAHAATNAVGTSWTLLLFLGGPHWILVSYLGVLGWIPLGAVCAWIVARGQTESGARPLGAQGR